MLTYDKSDRTYIDSTNVVSQSKFNLAPPTFNSSYTAKRLVDITGSIVIIFALLSWFVPIISCLIYFTSPGPIFFIQIRTGKNGRIFHCYKFRTMYVCRSGDFKQAEKNDPRITSIGRWLRKSNLDELPQFFNVLIGDMSLIGPRPHPPQLDAQFWHEIPLYEKRYQVYPGITGLAQVKGARGITDHPLKMKHRVKFDLFYQKNQSLALDLTIGWWTIKSMVKGDANAW